MTYVLVHGGGFGSGCWDRLLPHLDEPVVTVDLPGRGRRAGTDLREVGIRDCAEAVVEDLVAAGVDDAVLVGHSLAGVTLPVVLGLVPERLRAAVMVSAIIPAHGEPVLTTMAPATRAAVEPALAGGLYRPGGGAGLHQLCNDLDEEQTAWVVSTRTDDASRLITEPVDLSATAPGVPRWYVHLTLDQRVPPDLQEQCNSRWGGRRVDLVTGHMAMVAAPQELAAVLAAIHREPWGDGDGTGETDRA